MPTSAIRSSHTPAGPGHSLALAAIVAGQIALHRRVVLLSGAVGAWIAAMCLLVVLGVLTPPAGLLATAAVLVPT